MKSKFFYLVLSILSFFYLFLRFSNLESRLTFHLDQGLHLLETYEMVQSGKPRLIGPMISSKVYDGRGFFIGPQYYYILAILGQITKWNPLSITQISIIVDLLFWLIFIIFLKRKYSPFLAIITFSLVTFSNYFIVHSRFFWNPNFLIPIAILTIISLYFFQKNKSIKFLYFTSFLWGLAFSFHYSALLWGVFFLLILFINRKKLRLYHYFSIPLFFILGDLPYFIFELRHNFYNISTAIYVLTHLSAQKEFTPHYLIFPLIVFCLYFANLLFTRSKKLFTKILILFPLVIIFMTTFNKIDRSQDPLGHPPGWNYPIEIEISKTISQNCPVDYNIASTIGGDTRAYDLRFLLTVAACPPLAVDKYPQSKTIFLIAPPNRPPETENVWEIDSFKPFVLTQTTKLNDQIILYRLDKSPTIHSKIK